MTNPTIASARGVHIGLFLGLIALYGVACTLVPLVFITREGDERMAWLLFLFIVYLPQPIVLVAWICAVRAIVGLDQPLGKLARPYAILFVSGIVGVLIVAAAFIALNLVLIPNPPLDIAEQALSAPVVHLMLLGISVSFIGLGAFEFSSNTSLGPCDGKSSPASTH